jgi:putative heme transporter
MKDDGRREMPHLGWRRALLAVAVALVIAAVLVGGVGQLAGFAQLRETLREGEHAWLTVCAAAQLLVFGGYAGVYRGAVCFENGPRISIRLALRVVLAAFALTQTIAAAGAAGLAVHYWAMRRLGFGRRQAAVRVIGFNTLVYLVFGLAGFAAALLALFSDGAPAGFVIAWLAAIPILLAAATWFTAPGRVERWASPGGGWFRRALSIGVAAAWWVRRVLVAPDGRSLLLAAATYWLGSALSLWAALEAFGAQVGLASYVLAFTSGYAAQIVPLPFVATGGVDAATTFALNAVGVPLDVALLAVVANRVFSFWLPLWPSIVFAALLPQTGHQLARAAPRSDPARAAAT